MKFAVLTTNLSLLMLGVALQMGEPAALQSVSSVVIAISIINCLTYAFTKE